MPLTQQVSALMRSVAADIVAPRFRMLADHEIAEKSPGEIVTIVDREAELRLHEGLDRLALGARIVGEEACAADPSLLIGIGEGLVWLVDPLDGTANFADGRRPFGMMVALVEHGQVLAGWMLDPVTGRLCHAERGKGATCNDAPVRSRPTGARMPIAALATQFLPAEHREQVRTRAARDFSLVPIPRCAAESYPRLALGDNDIALFQRILPWDHAAGALFLTEAGGVATHWDGTPYRIGSGRAGMLAAVDRPMWDRAAASLLTRETGLIQLEDFTA